VTSKVVARDMISDAVAGVGGSREKRQSCRRNRKPLHGLFVGVVRGLSVSTRLTFGRTTCRIALSLLLPTLYNPHDTPCLPYTTSKMGAKDYAILLLTHPLEFYTLVQFALYHRANNRDISNEKEWAKTGWNRPTMRRSWEFLDKAGRSYAAVIKELDGELARTVSIHPSHMFIFEKIVGLSTTTVSFALVHVCLRDNPFSRSVSSISSFADLTLSRMT
jgi:hypothetical protein